MRRGRPGEDRVRPQGLEDRVERGRDNKDVRKTYSENADRHLECAVVPFYKGHIIYDAVVGIWVAEEHEYRCCSCSNQTTFRER